jgi:hypothetical protein
LVDHQVGEEGKHTLDKGALKVLLRVVFLKLLLKHPATLLVIAVVIDLPQDFLVLLRKL